MKKNGNKSEINLKGSKKKLFLSHEDTNDLIKTKSQMKLKIFDTINTKIKNLKYNSNRNNNTKTENTFIKKNKHIKIKENKSSFSN